MNNNNNLFFLIEYLSLSLILSYFFIHNILLVLIGIFYSIYSINRKSINILIRYYRIKNNNNNYYTSKIKESKKLELDNEKPSLNLVETVEELGFIPSLENIDEINTS